MASEALFAELARALGQDSRGLRAVKAASEIPFQAMAGYDTGAKFGDSIRERALKRQTLSEALGNKPLEEGIMNMTGEGGAAQNTNIDNIIALDKARKEAARATQLFGTRGDKGLVFNPNNTSISEIPLPGSSDEPIIPKAVSQTLSPYADPSGQPLAFTPGRGLTPVPSKGGTPVLKQGNEQAISDAALMQSQAPNIDKLFDAYKAKTPAMAKIQATPAGSALDPEAKQLENSLKLAAFTFGGKNLTGQEKQVVFGAFFPSLTDNPASREQKRNLLKNYSAGKIDLLQAANLLGPAGAPLRGMLQSKVQGSSTPSFGGAQTPTFANEQEAEASGYKGPAMINGKRAVIH